MYSSSWFFFFFLFNPEARASRAQARWEEVLRCADDTWSWKDYIIKVLSAFWQALDQVIKVPNHESINQNTQLGEGRKTKWEKSEKIWKEGVPSGIKPGDSSQCFQTLYSILSALVYRMCFSLVHRVIFLLSYFSVQNFQKIGSSGMGISGSAISSYFPVPVSWPPQLTCGPVSLKQLSESFQQCVSGPGPLYLEAKLSIWDNLLK